MTPKKDQPLLEHRPGYIRCLKCPRKFKSWDVRKNRICGPCNKSNERLDEGSMEKVSI